MATVLVKRAAFGVTDIGKRRMTNEDALLIDESIGLYAVADGMGGHNAGEIASREALDALVGMVRRDASLLAEVAQNPTPENARRCTRLLEAATQAATYMVYGIAQNDPNQQGMGTTLSALLLCGNLGFTAQVGDSRVYLVRDGRAQQLTEDHTLVAWQIKQGILTAADAAVSPHKNITRAVGSREYVQVDTHVFEISPGDGFLLCSDGLYTYVREEEISPIFGLGPRVAARRLIDLANDRGGGDNITAIVVQLEAGSISG